MTRSIRPTVGWKKKVSSPATTGTTQVAPVHQRRGRRGVDEDVAQEPSPQARGAGQHQRTEEVEVATDRHEGAGDREDEDPEQVDDHEDVGRVADGHGCNLSRPPREGSGGRAAT